MLRRYTPVNAPTHRFVAILTRGSGMQPKVLGFTVTGTPHSTRRTALAS